jgi:hypothetical protein
MATPSGIPEFDLTTALVRIIAQLVGMLSTSIPKIEATMAQLDDELKGLTDQVTQTSTDVQAILQQLASTGVSAEQHKLITDATSALKAQDDAMEAILNPPTANQATSGGGPAGAAKTL